MALTKLLKKAAISALLFGTLSSVTYAEYVKTDWLTEGDELAILDPETGKEWLNLSQTFGWSVNDIIGELEGEFSGWRIATQDETFELLSNLTGKAPATEGSQTTSSQSAAIVYYALGAISSSSYAYSWGLHHGSGDGFSLSGGLYNFSTPSRSSVYYGRDPNSYTADSRYTNIGVLLVNDGGVTLTSLEAIAANAVSVPMSVVSAGLLMLLVHRRKAKKTTLKAE
jgi:hypothetical protein